MSIDDLNKEFERGEREGRLKLARLQQEADLREVMSTPAGRRFVWRLIAPVMAPSFAGSENELTAYNEGARAAALALMARAQKVARGSYLEMWAERLRDLPSEDVPRSEES